MARSAVSREFTSALSVASALAIGGIALPVSAPAITAIQLNETYAQYDFSYATNGGTGGPPSGFGLSTTPFYVVDGANSGLPNNNPNIILGPAIMDQGAHGFDLFHESLFGLTPPPSSSSHPRYITSLSANGGSDDEGVAVFAGGAPVPASSSIFNAPQFGGGFIIDVDIEVNRTTAPSLESTLVRLPGVILAMNRDTPVTDGVAGGAIATIEGTFGTKVVASTTSLLKTGATRPQFNVKLIYLPNNPDSTNTLFLYVNDVLEDARNAPGITFANGVPMGPDVQDRLSILSNTSGSRRTLTDVMVTNLTIMVPEPSTVLLVAMSMAGLLLIGRRR